MLKLRQLKQEQAKRKVANAEGASSRHADGNEQRVRRTTSAAQLLIQKELSELRIPEWIKLCVPDVTNLMAMEAAIRPDQGVYREAEFQFSIQVSGEYPFEPPKVLCITPVFHPNIDLEGHVCLNILRDGWNPTLGLEAVLFGLAHLFLDPNPEDPLNQVAADEMRKSLEQFERNVRRTLKGGYAYNRRHEVRHSTGRMEVQADKL